MQRSNYLQFKVWHHINGKLLLTNQNTEITEPL